MNKRLQIVSRKDAEYAKVPASELRERVASGMLGFCAEQDLKSALRLAEDFGPLVGKGEAWGYWQSAADLYAALLDILELDTNGKVWSYLGSVRPSYMWSRLRPEILQRHSLPFVLDDGSIWIMEDLATLAFSRGKSLGKDCFYGKHEVGGRKLDFSQVSYLNKNGGKLAAAPGSAIRISASLKGVRAAELRFKLSDIVQDGSLEWKCLGRPPRRLTQTVSNTALKDIFIHIKNATVFSEASFERPIVSWDVQSSYDKPDKLKTDFILRPCTALGILLLDLLEKALVVAQSERFCEHCGQPLAEDDYPNKKTCSNKCRMAMSRKRRDY